MQSGVDMTPLAGELRVVLGRLVRRLRAEYRFPLTQAAVLGRLDRGGPESIAALAQAERVRPQSMSQTLAELEADGLVARRSDANDARLRVIELTDAGRQALELDRSRRDGWLAQAIAEELTDREQRVLLEAVGLLDRISQSS
jgi:DNA-binding MarR family transcriptional regulator